jgi:alpha-glucosidase
VVVQDGDPASLLNWSRHVLHLRRGSQTLRTGALRQCVARGNFLAFDRNGEGETIHCAFNLGPDAITFKKPLPGEVMLAANGATCEILTPHGAIFMRQPL